jgi:hypothetical protein
MQMHLSADKCFFFFFSLKKLNKINLINEMNAAKIVLDDMMPAALSDMIIGYVGSLEQFFDIVRKKYGSRVSIRRGDENINILDCKSVEDAITPDEMIRFKIDLQNQTFIHLTIFIYENSNGADMSLVIDGRAMSFWTIVPRIRTTSIRIEDQIELSRRYNITKLDANINKILARIGRCCKKRHKIAIPVDVPDAVAQMIELANLVCNTLSM